MTEPETAVPTVSATPIKLADSDTGAYAALSDGAVFFALPPRHVSRFTGTKSAQALNGLVTNDVLPLAVGRGLYAGALAPKGKMLADVAILRVEPEAYLVETSELAGREWWSMIRKYVNPRLAQYQDESEGYSAFGVYGPNAPAVLARLGVGGIGDEQLTSAMQQGLEAWPDWAHSSFTLPGMTVRLVRAPYLGAQPGFQLLIERGQAAAAALQLARGGALPGSDGLWQLAQLESGRPLFGIDMDASTIPQEANLDDWAAISYEKGCYTGQETVARIHFRGHVNKHLRGLRSDALLLPGASVHDENGKVVGDVRRSGLSPRLGNIGIGMIRRELAANSTVIIRLADSEVSARVVPLPFNV
ncbi:MAG: hypothetical protein H7Z40_12725 [Phycisphaerae bacterium]|nr:hypothetical protein [Gemmatimonadaceae bacterium]